MHLINLFVFHNTSAQIGQYDGILFLGGTISGNSSKIRFSEDFADENLHQFRNEFNSNAKFKNLGQFGFSLGVNAGINVSDRAGLLLNVAYNHNGYDYEIDELASFNGGSDAGVYRFEERLNFININPAIRVQLSDNYISPYFIFGPNFSMGLSGTNKKYFDSGSEDPILIGEIEDVEFGNDRFSKYKSLTVGFVLGTGISVHVNGNTRLVAELQRQHDFSNMYSKARIDYLASQENPVVGKKSLRSTIFRLGIEYIIQGDK